ncbi:MAG: DNA repair protein RecO [Bacteroidales bacterium]|jgi:DNA repair protein RecO (recombination protein O)|nr:DNA repair protein RecO [Bacteroidales bacterium]
MLQSTRGIVFHTVRYSDTSAVVKIYTEDFGMMSFLVKGLYGRKSKLRAAMFGHLSLLDLIVERQEQRQIHYIREAVPDHSVPDWSGNMSGSAIILYMNELLHKCIREEESNRPLFAFLVSVLQKLALPGISLQAFHLLFMLKLTSYLGFAPRLAKADAGSFFDMEEGLFLDSEPLHRYYITGPAANALEKLQLIEFEDLNAFRISPDVRNELLERLLEYYRLHIPEMGEMKSVKVLQELLA